MNGAEQATLDEMAGSLKDIRDILKSAHGDPKKGKGKDGGGFGQGIMQGAGFAIQKSISTVFSFGIKSIQLFTSGITKLTGYTAQASNAMNTLAAAATDGAASMSSVGDAVAQLPGPFKLVGGLMKMYASVIEKNIHAHEVLSRAGATFGGNLNLMRTSANKMYLSLDQFGKVVTKNSDIFATMGGNVQDGVNRFIKVQTALMAPGSPIANNLATLGFSMEEAADLTASYMRAQGSMSKSGLGDTKKTSEAVARYAQELTVLSEITGKNRQELQKELDKQNAEAQWKSFLSQMSQEKADKLRQAIQAATMRGGQGAVDALKAQAMGLGAPITEAGQLYYATQMEGIKANEASIKAANDDTISAEENRKRENAATAKFIVEQSKDQKKFQEILRIDAQRGGKLAESFASATDLQTAFMKDGKMRSEQEIVDMLNKRDAEVKVTNSTAAAAKNMQKGVMDLTNSMLNTLMPLFQLAWKIGMPVIQALAQLTPQILNFAMNMFNEAIIPAFKAVFGDISLDDLLQPAKDFFRGLFGGGDTEDIKTSLINGLQPIRDLGDNLLKGIDFEQLGADFREIFGSVGRFITTLSGSLSVAFPEGEGGLGGSLQRTFHKFTGGFSELMDGVSSVTKQILEHPAFQKVKEAVGKAIDLIMKIVHAIVYIIKSPLGHWLIDKFMGAVGLMSDAISWLADKISWVIDKVLEMVDWFGSGHWWEDIKEGISNFFKSIWNWIKSLPGKIMNLLATVLTWFIDSIKGFFSSIWNWIKSLPSNIMKILDGGLPALWEALKNILTSIGEGIKNLGKKLWDKATSWLPGSGDDAAEEARKKAEEAAAAKKKADEEAAAKKKAEEQAAAKKLTPAEQAALDKEEAKQKAAEEAAKKNATRIGTAYIDIANISKMNTEKRALGGPILPGQAYTVGENGPELFMSKQGGQILSNSAYKSALDVVSSKQSSLGKSESDPAEILGSFAKSIQDAVLAMSKNTSSHGLTSDQGKNLIAELQMLNKQTDVLRRIALDTAEHTKKAVSATKSLNGNLFA